MKLLAEKGSSSEGYNMRIIADDRDENFLFLEISYRDLKGLSTRTHTTRMSKENANWLGENLAAHSSE